jgi:selenocysteine lyase/cysteine desulfurase
MNSRTGLSRREFVRCLAAGSALSIAALDELNAGVYQAITSLNQKFAEEEAPDGLYWENLKKSFLFEDGLVMMNNGTVGPMPLPVYNTLIKYFKVQVTNPFDVYNFLPAKREQTRRKLAAFINASPEETAITSNTTEGINIVVHGLDLKEGDEVLVSDLEHPGAINPWRLKAKRFGIKIKEVHLPVPHRDAAEVVGAFAEAITPRTRVISVGHTVFITGLITPLKELSELARKKDILILGDSAHGLGMLNLDMKALGVDFFASSPYKWMGAPTGVGLLYVRKEVQDRVWPAIVSSGWDTHKDASRFDPQGQRADAMIYAMDEALDFQNAIGKTRVERRIKAMSSYLRRELAKIPGVRINTPNDAYLSAGLTAFSLEGVDPARVVDYVREKYNIVVRTVGSPEKGTYAVRVSTPVYVSFKEVDQFLEGVRGLARRKA